MIYLSTLAKIHLAFQHKLLCDISHLNIIPNFKQLNPHVSYTYYSASFLYESILISTGIFDFSGLWILNCLKENISHVFA